MTETHLSAGDAELRRSITELCVHIPCGMLRGPASEPGVYARRGRRWQSCLCEDNPVRWVNCDVSRLHELCIVCFRATAGGTSRWSWLACTSCRAVNEALGRPLALGRHSFMNGIGVRGGQTAEVTEQQIARLVAFARGDGRLTRWGAEEYARLAAPFDPQADVPLRLWQEQWPPSAAASEDAFSRLLDGQL